MIVAGCAGHQGGEIELPSADQFSREQLVFHSDFRLPRRHRLVDELAARRVEISDSPDVADVGRADQRLPVQERVAIS